MTDHNPRRSRKDEVRLNDYTRLFRRGDSPNWHAVIQFPKQERIRISTGVSHLPLAVTLTERNYARLADRWRRGLPLNIPTLTEAVDLWYADLRVRVEHRRLSTSSANNYRLVLDRDFVPWVLRPASEGGGDKGMDEFTDADMVAFREHRQKQIYRTKLKATSLNMALVAVNDLFKFAIRKNWISKSQKPVQDYVPVNDDDANRSQFSKDEYMALRRTSLKRIREVSPDGMKNLRNSRRYRERRILDFVIRIMANTGIRTAEMMRIRWIDCTPVVSKKRGRRAATVYIRNSGRRKKGRTIQVPAFVWHYLQKLREITGQPDNEPLMPYGDLEGSFTRLCKAAGLKVDDQGNNRTLYSLRHSFAQWAALRLKFPDALTARHMGHDLYIHHRVYARTDTQKIGEEFFG